jgi:predicted aspartyl protease
MDRPQSFTIDYSGIANILYTECGVCKAFIPGKSATPHPKVESFRALWDTGATNSVISKNVADKLGLSAISVTKAYHAGGENIVNVYLVNILLPNKVGIPSLRVTEGIINGTDVLIGMDIISKGDFSICTTGGKTKFSFQMPSTHSHDYVKEFNDKYHTPAVNPNKKVQRNDPCPCGNGKKYKDCHGKNL